MVVSMGCPCGVGPEVAIAGAVKARGVGPRLIIGDVGTLRAAAEVVGVKQSSLRAYTGDDPQTRGVTLLQAGPELSLKDRRPGRPGAKAGASQLEAVRAALDIVRAGEHRALVTAPVNKAAIARSGVRGAASFRGHTEWLEAKDDARESGRRSVMAFVGGGLATSLVTTHLPLAKVPRAIDADSVSRSILALARLLRAAGTSRPRVVVASLNPHAGEDGLLGREEARVIEPGVRAAARQLGRRAQVTGPLGAETAFRLHRAGEYDGVVAMYHDQATIPMKLLAFGEAVNVTVGLSFVRTSVDHGTAYDLAWKGRADPSGMVEAIKLAYQLARSRGYSDPLTAVPQAASPAPAEPGQRRHDG